MREEVEFLAEVEFYNQGIVYLSACAPAGMGGDQVAQSANARYPTGVASPGSVADEPFRTGEPNPASATRMEDGGTGCWSVEAESAEGEMGMTEKTGDNIAYVIAFRAVDADAEIVYDEDGWVVNGAEVLARVPIRGHTGYTKVIWTPFYGPDAEQRALERAHEVAEEAAGKTRAEAPIKTIASLQRNERGGLFTGRHYLAFLRGELEALGTISVTPGAALQLLDEVERRALPESIGEGLQEEIADAIRAENLGKETSRARGQAFAAVGYMVEKATGAAYLNPLGHA